MTAAATNSTTKQRRVVELALAEGLLDVQATPFESGDAWPGIEEVHDAAYVEAVRTGEPRRLAGSQGFSWSPAFAESVARIWHGHLAACRLAMHAGVVLHPVSGAHHAGYASGSGFCTFNFLVGSARSLLTSGIGPVAIVDLDAHPGDGTYRLAKEEHPVALFDIAGGAWVSVANSPHVEYHVVRDVAAYRQALGALPAFLDRVRPALVQYQAGMDPLEDDPIGGIAGVDAEFLGFRDRFVIGHVLSRGIPLVINLAGGYIDEVTERLHLETVRIAVDVRRRQSELDWRRAAGHAQEGRRHRGGDGVSSLPGAEEPSRPGVVHGDLPAAASCRVRPARPNDAIDRPPYTSASSSRTPRPSRRVARASATRRKNSG